MSSIACYGVMNARLKERAFLAGTYSIADMACVGWIRLFERQAEKNQTNDLDGFAHLKRWLVRVRSRPAVKRGMSMRIEEAGRVDVQDPKVRAVLFGQRARHRLPRTDARDGYRCANSDG